MPQVCASPASKRRVRNGIASSAYQPLATMRVLGEPEAVPVDVGVAAVVHHLRVPFRAHRVDREHVAVALVVEGVEHDLEHVGSRGVEVLLQIADDDVGGRAVVGEDAEIQRLLVVGDAHFGLLRRRLPFVRLALQEAAGDRRVAPDRLVERAVDRDRRRRSSPPRDAARGAPFRSSPGRRPVRAEMPARRADRDQTRENGRRKNSWEGAIISDVESRRCTGLPATRATAHDLSFLAFEEDV